MSRTMPYNIGAVGLEQVVSANIAFSDDTVAVVALSADCLITRVVAEVEEAFNAGTTNVLTVGTNAAVDDLLGASDVTEATPGLYESATFVAQRLAAAATVKAKYACSGTDPTEGKATVYVFFVRLQP